VEEIRVIHRDQDAFAIFVRDYVLQVDQPTRTGEQSGPTPVELFVAGLAGCIAHFAYHHLKAKGLPYNGLEVGARYLLGGPPPQRVARLTFMLRPPSKLREDDTREMIEAVRDCPITQSLQTPPQLHIDLDEQAKAA